MAQPTQTTPRTQRERSETTTGEIVAAARRRFAADGFRSASIDGVAAAAGVTKGAVYHHFADKTDLFRAVHEAEQAHLAEIVAAAYRRGHRRDPWTGFRAGCHAYFEAFLDPAVQRIVLVEAPSVLGRDETRDIADRHTTVLVERGLRQAIDAGLLAERPVAPLAHLLNGAMCEAATMAARDPHPRVATRDALRELDRLLDALAQPRQRAASA